MKLAKHKVAVVMAVLGAVLLFVVPQFLKNYGVYLLTYWLVFISATMGLNLTVRYAGQKSLGHAAFFGIVGVIRWKETWLTTTSCWPWPSSPLACCWACCARPGAKPSRRCSGRRTAGMATRCARGVKLVLPAFGASVVVWMVWLPDGLLSLPDRLRARREAREASRARTAAASKMGAAG